MTDELERAGDESGPQSQVDDRSAFAKALDLATQVTTICLTLALPAVGGYFLDRWLGWGLIWTSLGLVAGLGFSGWQLVALVRRMERDAERRPQVGDRRVGARERDAPDAATDERQTER